MKDINGVELQVGDPVVYVYGKNSYASLKTGNVTKIYDNDKECSVGRDTHIYNFRIMKLGRC